MSRHFRIGFGRYQGLKTEKFFSVFLGKTSFKFEGITYYRDEIRSYLCWCEKNRGKFKADHQIHRLVALWHEIIDQESDGYVSATESTTKYVDHNKSRTNFYTSHNLVISFMYNKVQERSRRPRSLRRRRIVRLEHCPRGFIYHYSPR